MRAYNPKNERIKKDYIRFLKEADRKAESTIDAVRKAISRYETYTGLKDFATFNREQAVAFKKHLAKTKAERSGGHLTKSTLHATTNALKAFFGWLSCQPGHRSRIKRTDIEYLNLSDKEVRAAKQSGLKRFPTLEQIRKALFAMPIATVIERRDRAIVAFAIVTGMRDDAIASLRLKHIDLEGELVVQDPLEVRTKFSKKIITYFFPVGIDLKQVVIDWMLELREEMLYGNDDPAFPKTKITQDENLSFKAEGLEPGIWANAEPIRKIFRQAFAQVGLPYFNPHSFRDTLVQFGKKLCRTPEEFEAWSKNLGHEQMLTTFRSYGSIDPTRQGELIKSITSEQTEESKLDQLMAMMKRFEAASQAEVPNEDNGAQLSPLALPPVEIGKAGSKSVEKCS
jgi:integrase